MATIDHKAQSQKPGESNSAGPSEDLLEKVPRQSVLLVDDSRTDLLYMTRLLEAPDRHVLAVRSGEEALKMLQGVEFALVILDVHMDGLSGIETAKLIRENEKTQHIPIIFVTGTGKEDEQIFRAYDTGAVDYLLKPVEPNLLRSKVNVFCELSVQRVVIQRQLDEIQAKNEVLNRQIEEIKTLRGLVPICAKCKNVRDDSGFWQSIENYVSEHSEAEFSHSLCPGCRDELYPGL